VNHLRLSRVLKRTEVHFTPEQEARLAQIATQQGTDAVRLVKGAALRLLEEAAFAPPRAKVLLRRIGASSSKRKK
jgi:hypothetical protein